MGLPEWDSVRLTIEGEGGLEGTSAGMEVMDEETTELWVATRCLDRNQTLADRFGKNEKTKVIGKLQKLGGGAPAREAAVSEEEKKAMMAYYFKKQGTCLSCTLTPKFEFYIYRTPNFMNFVSCVMCNVMCRGNETDG